MARVIEENIEHKVYCNHCLKLIGFTIKDTRQTYERGLEDGEGWLDCDCVWNYITCPNCGGTISVNNVLTDEEYCLLANKYKNN